MVYSDMISYPEDVLCRQIIALRLQSEFFVLSLLLRFGAIVRTKQRDHAQVDKVSNFLILTQPCPNKHQVFDSDPISCSKGFFRESKVGGGRWSGLRNSSEI